MKAVVRYVRIPRERRTLVISDIHGNLPWLRALLEKAAFTEDDVLILLGDLVEKGAESLATLRFVMDLCKTHTVYPLCGNCDNLAVDFVDDAQGLGRDFFRFYLNLWREKALVLQMAAEAGFRVEGEADLPAFRALLRARFAPELSFLRGLPTVLETEDFVFVHGGVPALERMEELDAWGCMKNDDFMGQGLAFPKYCVVGHWPVTLYRPGIPCGDPLIDRERRIISIDGGCALNADGQLNALILPAGERTDFSWVRYDGCPVRTALDPQAGSRDPFTIRWTDHAVEVLERGAEFSLVRHRSTGRTLEVLTRYLGGGPGEAWCDNYTDYRLPVAPGDTLSVVEETSRGTLVKKDGVTGWYLGRLGV